MKPPRTKRGLLNRLIFIIVGAFFAMGVYIAVHSGRIRLGRTGSDYILVGDEPVRFWTCVAVSTLMSALAFYCAFSKGKLAPNAASDSN
jgi:hypothetical protein